MRTRLAHRIGGLLALGSVGLAVAFGATATSAATTTKYLSDMTWKSATNGWGPVEKNRSNGEQGSADGHTIRLNGASYAKGLGAHAYSDVRYQLAKACTWFSAVVGVDDEVGTRGSVVFKVFADGTKRFDSGLLTGSSPSKPVELDLSSRPSELRLVVENGGNGSAYDHADWANAQVRCDSGTTTTTPPPTTTTPPPPPPYVPGARWYSASSAFNTAISSSAAIDPSSAVMVQTLVRATPSTGVTIAAGAWTVPVFIANASTPRYDVRTTSSWANGRTLYGVPIPANAAPDPQGDGHMMVIDSSTNCEYDFWQARKTSTGAWTAGTVARLELEGSGVTTNGARAASFGLGAGLIRPEELAAGQINHALVFSYPTVRSGMVVSPATGGSGDSTEAGAIPLGAHVRLDPALNLDTLGLTPWQKTIARALQVYGMYLGDHGGVLSLYAQNKSTVPSGYPWGTGTYAYLPASLVSHFQVLRLGSPATPNYQIIPSRCGTFNF
jgi:hypothetical protein